VLFMAGKYWKRQRSNSDSIQFMQQLAWQPLTVGLYRPSSILDKYMIECLL
jgi:hypothetical protein